MRKHSKLLLTALVAALTLGTMVGTASANRLSLSTRNIRAVWTPLTFIGLEGSVTIRCNVTLEGSFHSNTIPKVAGLLIGYITRANLTRPCAGGEAWILNGTEVEPEGTTSNSLPWHVRYRSFSGTLPNITGVTLELVNASFRLIDAGLGLNCLYRSTTASPARGIATVSGGQITGLRADETGSIPRAEGNIFCPSNGRFGGTGTVRVLNTTTTLVFIRLI